MTILKKFVENTFNINFDKIPFPQARLYPMDNLLQKESTVEEKIKLITTKEQKNSWLFGTKEAIENPLLIGWTSEEMFALPCGYFMFGHWGHGVNSYSLYYARIDQNSKVYFRLPYGGVYMDNEKCAKDIGNFFKNYFKFEETIKDTAKKIIAVEDHRNSYYTIEMYSNEKIKVNANKFFITN